MEVDYFSAALPPAMFFTWTFQMPLMKPESWRELVGTTAEWLFLSQVRGSVFCRFTDIFVRFYWLVTVRAAVDSFFFFLGYLNFATMLCSSHHAPLAA